VNVDFHGKVALVTGGSDGVGSGCARVFVEAGATVVICSRSRERGESFAKELTDRGPGTCRYAHCDVSDTPQLQGLIDGIIAQEGRLDTLVNNAGQNFGGMRPIDDIPVEDFVRLLGINMVPYFAASKFALPFLREARGSIVNIGSIVSEAGQWWNTDYTSTKGAIASFTKALAVDETASGVRVNAVLPGNVMTRSRQRLEAEAPNGALMHEFMEAWQWMGRSGSPEEIGYPVLFLASEYASYITGATLIVSGGVELAYGRKGPYVEFFAT
jgi:NAD(P)-dependent dehydrogenase (short-subunit alcohol dehydrogenase family)